MDNPTRQLLSGHLRMFARNFKWGTCVECPRDVDDNVYPEFCKNTERYDHNLSLDDLYKMVKREL